jgi:hypothetical protein
MPGHDGLVAEPLSEAECHEPQALEVHEQQLRMLAGAGAQWGMARLLLTLSRVPVGKNGSTSVKEPTKSLGSA